MESSKVSADITYRKPGTQPPVYVAGTFSHPPWVPHEMAYTTDEEGEHVFTQEITAEPGTKIQYKFRLGLGDWWVLHGDVPTVKDSDGNVNHELVMPQRQGVFNLSSATSKPERGGLSKDDTNGDAVSPKTMKPNDGNLPPVDKADVDAKHISGLHISASAPTYDSIAAEAKPDGGVTRLVDKPEVAAKHILASHSGTSTPTYANIAAEVADSAALLNKEKPETPIPDEEAGKIGYRRLSSTPIVEVANTAAEVADTARYLDDPEEVVGFRTIPVHDGSRRRDDFLRDDDEVPDTKAPLFSHECVGMYKEDDPQESDAVERSYQEKGSSSEEENPDDIDLNDPTLERFPSNREEIIDAVRKLETGLDEDQALFEGVPPSPVVGPSSRRGTEDAISDLLSPTPVSPTLPRALGRLAMPRSPRGSVISAHSSMTSLQAIAESEEPDPTEESRLLPAVPRSVGNARSSFQSPSSDEDEGVVLKVDGTSKMAKGENNLLPPSKVTPSPGRSTSSSLSRGSPKSLDNKAVERADGSSKPSAPVSGPAATENNQNGSPRIVAGTAENDTSEGAQQEVGGHAGETSATEAAADASSAQLRKRKAVPEEQQDEAGEVSEPPVARPPERAGGWLTAFFRLIFVDWLGGFINRLCGGRRKT